MFTKSFSQNYKTTICLCFLFLILTGNNFSFAQKIAQFSFEGNTGETSAIDSITKENCYINNHFIRPERVTGVAGNALRLDGYSTWASSSSYQFKNIDTKMSISAWYAPEAFTKENAAIISQIDNASGFALSIGLFGNVVFEFYVDQKKFSFQTAQSIKRYAWNYIVATIDLANKQAKIWVNGTEWANLDLLNPSLINLSGAPLMLGRHNNSTSVSGFLVTALNGAIDEVCVYKSVLTINEILPVYQANSTKIPNLTINPFDRYKNDYLRPHFHAMPNAAWTNEPYGLIFYKGKYHLFFQKNPNAPDLFFMHWGHLSSTDLVNWKEEKIALAPNPGFDSFGIWSGSSIKDKNGSPVLIYTGVDGAKAGIGSATCTEDSLIHWTRNALNPMIPNPPVGLAAMDFRDPFVWASEGNYYMIVGSGLQNNGGGILFTYKSADLLNWTNINPLYKSSLVDNSGIFWEMPFFCQLQGSTYILGVTPVPTPNKPAQTLYWIGEWKNETFRPFNSVPNKIELINNRMLSPSFGLDEANRITYIGIIPEDRDGNAQVAGEWRHTFCLPRVTRLLNDSLLGQVPHPNLCRLRQDVTSISHRIVQQGTKNNLPEITGNQLETLLKVKADSASKFTLQVFKHADGQEFTSLIFDLSQNRISCDRRQSALSGMTLDYTGSPYIFNFKDTINIRVFLDHSILEVFVDQITVFSCRIYPTRVESQRFDFITNIGKAEIVELNAWKMKDMRDVSTTEVCEPTNLPTAFRKPIVIKPAMGLNSIPFNELELKAYPNPTNSILTLEVGPSLKDSFLLKIIDINGRVVETRRITLADFPDRNKIQINVSMLQNGFYFLSIQDQSLMVKFQVCR